MKKIILLSLVAASTACYGATTNILPVDQLMFYSIVGENTSQELEEQYPEYTAWLTDTDVLLLLNFITSTDKTVIVKFSADWCTPCKRFAPIMHDALNEYMDEVVIIDINIDYAPTLREMFNVKTVPTLIYFKNGQQVDRTNSVSKEALLDKIKALIDKKNNKVS